ncbi:MAG: DUF4276 family protein [Chloroflexi bacterium]|nr:DUF4276 family protein [Chloroflexota bacterium]
MTRLLVEVEGPTEETFVTEVLRTHLIEQGFIDVNPRILGNARLRSNRGGIRSWPSVKVEILRHLKSDSGLIVTTMVDYYGLPRSGSNGWPGRQQAAGVVFEKKADAVQDALKADICSELGESTEYCRFIPYVMMHEFEAMLFSDCASFAVAIDRPDLEAKFQAIRDQFVSPEEINDSSDTAPSKRIVKLMPEYDKILHGYFAASDIGIENIKSQCVNFSTWLSNLESIP